MKVPISPEYRVQCDVRLGELSRTDLINLTEFAERRLSAQGLDPSAGEDVSQRALMAILRGLRTDQGGRVPRLVDLESKDAFINFIRGAISSIIEAMGRKRQLQNAHVPWRDDLAQTTPGLLPGPQEAAELNDLKDQLFPQLRARAPKRLQRTIDAWEPVFTYSDRIPAPGNRSYVKQVQNLAQEIVTELGGIR
jgi:hypothetical protein